MFKYISKLQHIILFFLGFAWFYERYGLQGLSMAIFFYLITEFFLFNEIQEHNKRVKAELEKHLLKGETISQIIKEIEEKLEAQKKDSESND